MIAREGYYNAVRKYFNFLVDGYDFLEVDEKSKNSMLYNVEYTDKNHTISISYEIMGEGVNIVIFKILNNKKSDYEKFPERRNY